jgi:hypothetical protein
LIPEESPDEPEEAAASGPQVAQDRLSRFITHLHLSNSILLFKTRSDIPVYSVYRDLP